METYRYDLHVHTCEVSACARSKADDMAVFYKEQGFAGIVITNHFFNGNTTVPRDGSISWEEMVDRYYSGYEIAKAKGDEIGLDVFFGWECSFYGGSADIVTLGLDKDWLYAHPNVHKTEPVPYFNLVHSSGGFLVHAHPFLQSAYSTGFHLFPYFEDAVEIANAGKTDFANARAKEYAENFDLPVTGGSDSHSTGCGKLCGIELDRRAESITDIINAVRSRENRVFTMKVIKEEKQ